MRGDTTDPSRWLGDTPMLNLSDDKLRLRTSSEALETAKRHFSAEACYADLLGYLDT